MPINPGAASQRKHVCTLSQEKLVSLLSSAARGVAGVQSTDYSPNQRCPPGHWCLVCFALSGAASQSIAIGRRLGEPVQWQPGGRTPCLAEDAGMPAFALLLNRPRGSKDFWCPWDSSAKA